MTEIELRPSAIACSLNFTCESTYIKATLPPRAADAVVLLTPCPDQCACVFQLDLSELNLDEISPSMLPPRLKWLYLKALPKVCVLPSTLYGVYVESFPFGTSVPRGTDLYVHVRNIGNIVGLKQVRLFAEASKYVPQQLAHSGFTTTFKGRFEPFNRDLIEAKLKAKSESPVIGEGYTSPFKPVFDGPPFFTLTQGNAQSVDDNWLDTQLELSRKEDVVIDSVVTNIVKQIASEVQQARNINTLHRGFYGRYDLSSIPNPQFNLKRAVTSLSVRLSERFEVKISTAAGMRTAVVTMLY